MDNYKLSNGHHIRSTSRTATPKKDPSPRSPPPKLSPAALLQIKALQKYLDQQELQLQNYHLSPRAKPQQQFDIYKEYLGSVYYMLHLSSHPLSSCLLRGLKGLTKVFERCQSPKALPTKPLQSEQSVQTEDGPVALSDGIQHYKELLQSLKDLRYTKIAAQLRLLLDSLASHPGAPLPSNVRVLSKQLQIARSDLHVDPNHPATLEQSIQAEVRSVSPDFDEYLRIINWKNKEIATLRRQIDNNAPFPTDPKASLIYVTHMEQCCMQLEFEAFQLRKELKLSKIALRGLESGKASTFEHAQYYQGQIRLRGQAIKGLKEQYKDKGAQLQLANGLLCRSKAELEEIRAEQSQIEIEWKRMTGFDFIYSSVQEGKTADNGQISSKRLQDVQVQEERGQASRSGVGQSGGAFDSQLEEVCERADQDSPAKDSSKKHRRSFTSQDAESIKQATQKTDRNDQKNKSLPSINKPTSKLRASLRMGAKKTRLLPKIAKQMRTKPAQGAGTSHPGTPQDRLPDVQAEAKPQTQATNKPTQTGTAGQQAQVSVSDKHTQVDLSRSSQPPKHHKKSGTTFLNKLRRFSNDDFPGERNQTLPPSDQLELESSTLKLKEYPDLFDSVFSSPKELQRLQGISRITLVNLMKGHGQGCSKYEGMCPHLRKAMEIKLKDQGAPYPLKYVLIQSPRQ